MSWELGVLVGTLCLLAALVYGPNAVDGGFTSDAWSNRALYALAPGGGYLNGLDALLSAPVVMPRPLQGVLIATMNLALGENETAWLIAMALLAVLMSVSVFVLLRELTVPGWDAGAIAVLLLIFPAMSSLRLWTVTTANPLTVTLVALGFVLALRAFAAEGRARIVMHVVSLLAFVSSLLLYEAALPLMLASVLLYRLRVLWRPAIARWLVDCAVLLPLVLLVTRSASSPWETQGLAGMWDHGVTIADQSVSLLAGVVLPFADSWYVLVGMAVALAVPIYALARLPADDPSRAAMTRWLALMAGGLAVVLLAYAIYVPAADFYVPLGPGAENRVNTVAGVGWVLIAYGWIRLAVAALLLGAPPSCRSQLALGATVATCLALSLPWLQQVARDSDDFTLAAVESDRALSAVRDGVPSPAPGTMIWAFGQPQAIAPGVVVFSFPWELLSAVRLMYDDWSMQSYAALEGTTFECRSNSIVPGGNAVYEAESGSSYARDLVSRYGRTYFVDTVGGRAELIESPEQCRRVARSFPRSPLYRGA